jgi:hypothetical protein
MVLDGPSATTGGRSLLDPKEPVTTACFRSVYHERPGYASVRRLADCIRPGYSTFVILPAAMTRHGPLSTDASAWYV